MYLITNQPTNKIEMYECVVCGKKYARKIYGEQHYLVCKLLAERESTSVQQIESQEIESGDTPTMREMYDIIRILAKKVDTLEKENEKWKSQIRVHNKKVDVLRYLETIWKEKKHHDGDEGHEMNALDWLDKQYHDMFKNKHVTIESVFAYGIRKTASILISNICQQYHGKFSELPIQCFNHKSDRIYMYIGINDKGKEMEMENEHPSWITCDSEQLKLLLQRLHKVILSEYFIWVDQNRTKMQTDDRFYQNVYVPNQQKAMILNITEIQFGKLIYNQFSQPSSNIMMYSCS